MGGTASIQSLGGLGGNLENNQPLPTSAARLTTGFNNGDKAEVGTLGDFGSAAALGTLTAGYSYYKGTVPGGNATAAPSLKLTIFAPGGTGDNYGQLVYEPGWNLGPGSQPPPTDAWQTVSIGPGTGAGDTSTGGWWWTGGFEIASGAGGPPIRSLGEWLAAFQASDPTDFANARIVGISMGVGTYNQGQVGYFDNVSLSVPGGANVTYDFELAVPEPASLAILSGGLAALGGLGWLRSRRRNPA